MEREGNKLNYGKFTEEDGIIGSFDIYDGKNCFTMTITHPDGRVLTRDFPWSWEPRFGVDISDWDTAERIADELIKELRDV